jgi:DNA topoisomerase I
MASKLLIVESPAKARTLLRYLGKDYAIQASVGHIRDLPNKSLAVDIDNNFKPDYEIIPEKKKTVEQLRKAADKAKVVLLAMDPDREGEAIAWHIAHLLGGQKRTIQRVTFNEITKNAVLEAVNSPGEINQNRVDAQQARRVLDRLVGYLVSKELWGVIARGLSAGRVQSVALRLVVEREQEIDVFVPEEYWNFHAMAELGDLPAFRTKLTKLGGEDLEINSEALALQVGNQLENLPARLLEIRRRINAQKPKAPFTTSTLQQEASHRLGMGGKRTMRNAQVLYEGVELSDDTVGLITYMRTDSTRISPEAIGATREFIDQQFGGSYLSPKPRQFSKAKDKRTQDAHEAIRPTDVTRTPASVKKHLKRDEFRLYELIWNRFVATQMADALFDGITVDIGVGSPSDLSPELIQTAISRRISKLAEKDPKLNPKDSALQDRLRGEIENELAAYLLRSVGRRLVFPGFRRLWGEVANDEAVAGKNDEEVSDDLPEALFRETKLNDKGEVKAGKAKADPQPGDPAEISDIESEQKFTQPPPRYSEATLVKMLDELGIGRPSTYAQIISTIMDRKYVESDDKRRLKPTDLGRTVIKVLVNEFEHVFNTSFTADMEEALDKVEDGGEWTETVRKFWEPFSERIEHFKLHKDEIKKSIMTSTGRACPQCGEGELVERWGRFGKFVSCNRYPDCKFIEKNGGENGEAKAEPEVVGRKCPTCDEGDLVYRMGRNGKFIGCNRYPKCKHTEQVPGEEGKQPNLPDVKMPCPREGCGGTVVAKRTRRGKLFYSCTNWKEKKCKVAFWDEPVERVCPSCSYPLMTKKAADFVCSECKHKEPNPDAPPPAKKATTTIKKKAVTKKVAAKKKKKPAGKTGNG